jgi:RNA polymerase sigma factor (sigma-70 family)
VTDGDLGSGSLRRSTRLLFEGPYDVDVVAALRENIAPHGGKRSTPDRIRTPFDEFYRAEMATLVRFVRRYGADVYAAADAAQDAFAEAYPQWNTIENPRAWLRLVACRIYYRRRLRETPVEEVPDRPVIYDDTVELREQGRRVFEALAALPERQRQVMAWHLDGYDNTEIAQHLRITEAAVRQNLCRGRKALKRWLGIETNDQEGENR